MNIVEVARARYATKKFDPTKKIPDADFEQVKDLLRLSPSSINSQPWHFIVASTEDGKQKIARSAEGSYAANHPKIMNASHVVLFCAKKTISDEYLQYITDQEEHDGRFSSSEGKALAMKVRSFYTSLHRVDWDDVACWTQKQVYLNMGTVLLGAGALGIDAVPIEGVDFDVIETTFELGSKDLAPVAVVALGYQAEDDFNAALPKSRLPKEEIFTFI